MRPVRLAQIVAIGVREFFGSKVLLQEFLLQQVV